MSDGEDDIFAEQKETNGGSDLFADSEVSLSDPSPAMSPNTGSDAPVSSGAATESKRVPKGPSGDSAHATVVTVREPEKIGDGMSAFMVYNVITKTTAPAFRKPELSVKRRFSDFLGLHEKLQLKHLPNGMVLPPVPEKSVLGMTKMKMSKEDNSNQDFVERRRASLERYMNGLARHHHLSMDPDFREFLEFEGDLPRSTSTGAFSGASVLKMFKTVGDAVGKIAFKMDETDPWFEEKHVELENLEKQLTKLHTSFETLVAHRKDFVSATATLASSCSQLSNVEENTLLARALNQLALTEEKIGQIHKHQAETDFYCLSEVIRDYIGMIHSIRETLNERVKVYKSWKDAETALTKKREQKVKMELANKTDKIPMLENEIRECESAVEREKQNFEQISETIKDELGIFDVERVHDIKAAVVKCLEEMVTNQEEVIQSWEAYLPDAKAVS